MITRNTNLTNLFDLLFNNGVFDDVISTDVAKADPASTFYNSSANIVEKDDRYVVEFACPGLTKNDVTVTVEGSRITIDYKTQRTDSGESDKKYVSRSWYTRSMHETFEIPEDVDETQVSAAVRDGVLYVTMPKLKVQPTNKRTISVE